MWVFTAVEAAGIEPASRDIFMKASTRVVDYLILARVDSNRQDATRASRKQIWPEACPAMTSGDSELVTGFQDSPTKSISQSRLYLGS